MTGAPSRIADIQKAVDEALRSDWWRGEGRDGACTDVIALAKVEPGHPGRWVGVELYVELHRDGKIVQHREADNYDPSRSPESIADAVRARALDVLQADMLYPDLPIFEAVGRRRADLIFGWLVGEVE
ncbi:hypothetical protein [Paludisphaera sp.]|uniref:hypothetical protein n=1 Tax=Paludisphaera sp. TaxID=2017432 RepID=UPI00301D3D65